MRRKSSVDEDTYAEKLYKSRSAKIKRWCSLRTGHPENDVDVASPSSASHPSARLFRYQKEDQPMPTIMITNDEDSTEVQGSQLVNDIPWVDWLEDYKLMKERETQRRLSNAGTHHVTSQEAVVHPQQPSHATEEEPRVQRRLLTWWSSVKDNAEHFHFSRRFVPHIRRHSSKGDLRTHPKRHRSSLSFEHDTLLPLDDGQDDFEPGQPKPKLRRCHTSPSEADLKAGSDDPAVHEAKPSVEAPHAPRARPTQVTYRFTNPPTERTSLFGRLGRIFSSTPETDSSSMRMQSTIRTRLQCTKEACDAEMRSIIDGLNEYVERGLQYVENMDEILEQGVHHVGSEDDDSHSEEDEEYREQEHMHPESVGSRGEGYFEQGAAPREPPAPVSAPIPPPPPSASPAVAGPAPAPAQRSPTARTASPSKTGDLRKRAAALPDIQEQEEGAERAALRPDQPLHRQVIQRAALAASGESASRAHAEEEQYRPHEDETAGHEFLQPAQQPQTGVNQMVTMISEDSYLPTPFILTLQDLIALAQSVMDTPLQVFLEHRGSCADIVSRIQTVGAEWDKHTKWPCREWYVRLLLGVAALNRVLDWWEAERGFWATPPAVAPTATTTASTSDVDGGDLESVSAVSRADDSEYGDRPRVPTTSSDGRFEAGESGNPHHFMSDETASMYTDDQEAESNANDDSVRLQEEAERSQNDTIIMELSLGTTAIQYVSPVWLELVGYVGSLYC